MADVEVAVFHDEYFSTDRGGEPVDDFIRKILEHCSKIPAEYRHTAKIFIGAVDNGYGCECSCGVELGVFYTRPETPDEAAKRERLADLRKKEQTMRELDQLRRLQAKYGG